MIKKILAVLAVVAIALPVCTMAQSKFGIVNPDAIMRDLPELANAQKELEAVSAKYQKEDSVLQTEIQLKYDACRKPCAMTLTLPRPSRSVVCRKSRI